MSNAARIVSALDGLLTRDASLIISGRAAIALGFENPPQVTRRSLDVDAPLRSSYETTFADTPEFWDAQEELDRILEDEGLYLTHIFPADMVFLRQRSTCCSPK